MSGPPSASRRRFLTASSASRRRFLTGLAGLGLAALAGGGLTLAMRRRGRQRTRFEEARFLLPYWESAVAVGAEYLAAHPGEADAERLVVLLELPVEIPGGAAASRRAALDALGASLRERHRADFREGRVLEIGGWTLSLTELRLAAMAFLMDGDR